MAKKKEEQENLTPPPFPSVEGEPVQPEPPLISKVMWSGVKEVYRCGKCGTNRDDFDAMVEHVILHFPLSEAEVVFEKLMKEK